MSILATGWNLVTGRAPNAVAAPDARAGFRRCTGLFLVCAAVLASGQAHAVTCTSNANGNWNAPATWSGCAGGNGTVANTPGSNDDVIITGNDTVTVNVNSQARSVTFAANTGNTNLTHNAGIALTVGAGGVTINGSSTNNSTHAWNINAGNATVNGAVLLNQGSNNSRVARINLTTGSLDINGNLTMTTTNNTRTAIAATGVANVRVSGNFTLTNGLGTLTPGASSTFTYDTATAASVATGGAIQYRNLTINKSGGTATTLAAPGTRNFTVLGALNVQAGTLNVSGVNAAITGATSVSGTLQISSTTGTKTFTGDVTINPGGTWNNGADEAVTMAGSLTNNNVFTSGTGLYTFTTNGDQWAGTAGITFSGSVAVNGTRTNNTTTTIVGNLSGSSTLTNGASQTLNIGGNANGINTLNASAADNTVNYNGTAAQIIENATYHHLTVSNNTGPVTLNGNTVIRGDFTNNGNFNGVSGNRTVTFSGPAAQAITGTSPTTSLYRLTLNNANGLALSGTHSLTITNLLTLTAGPITTGSNYVYISNGSAIGSVGGNDFVIGNLRKNYTGGNVTRVFEVGSGLTPAARYTPVTVRLGSVSVAGDFTVSTTGSEHPNIGTSTLDSTQSVNRYWTLTNNSVTFAANANNLATFTFVAADIDGGAATGSFFVGRFNSPNWTEITPTARTATTTTISGAGITQANIDGEYAIGERAPVVPPPGDFNAFETSTAANAITGKVFTKLVGVNFSLDIVAILAGAQHATFTNTVAVDLVTGSTGGLNCPGTPVAIAGTSQNVNLASGRGTTAAFNIAATAYRDVRVRVRFPVSSPTVTSCSTDNFAIRPTGLTVTSTNASGGTAATNTATTGTPAIKTGANFNLRATALAGYDGTPSINNTLVTGTPTAGTIGGSFGAAAIGTGIADGNAFYYSEVGHFGLGTNAVFDSGFTSVDSGGGDCTNDFSNALVGGRYGCNFGSTAVTQSTGVSGFGRFIPDNFNVSVNVPVLAPACTGFSYVGQNFNYSTAPVMTITARNGTSNGLTNATTVNYAGSYMKFANDNTSLAQAAYDTQAERYARFDALGGGNTPALDLAGLPATSADPAIGTFTNGVGTFTFSGGGGLAFVRNATTPSAAFDADIALALNVVDADGVAFAGNPAAFGAASAGNGILFSDADAGTTNDAEVRYGRLRIGGASGSQQLPLRLPVEAQYWNGAVFATNTLDSCTALSAANVGLGNYVGALTAGDTAASIVNSPLQDGRSAISLSAPGSGNQGSVDVTLNLGDGGNADACDAFAPAAAAGNLDHLRGRWCDPPGSYSKDPAVRARFGIQRSSDQAIYRREQ
jgi:MSHA biogenesis protein MshQ